MRKRVDHTLHFPGGRLTVFKWGFALRLLDHSLTYWFGPLA